MPEIDIIAEVQSPQPWISARLAILGGSCYNHGVFLFATPAVGGDLNADGELNTLDLGLLLSHWDIPPGSPACGGGVVRTYYINLDGHVNAVDLGILLSTWTF